MQVISDGLTDTAELFVGLVQEPVCEIVADGHAAGRGKKFGKVRLSILKLFAIGEQLYARIQGPKRFVRFPGAGHNELGARGAVDVAKQFLAGE